MSRIAPLYGDHDVVNEYNERVAEKLNTTSSAVEGRSSTTVGLNRGIQQLLHDITIYNPYDSCLGTYSYTGALFDAKKEFYRLISLLLSDLGLIFGISPNQFDILFLDMQTLQINVPSMPFFTPVSITML